jgi:hypothetical protein
MRNSDRIALTNWAIAYHQNPATLSRSPSQALAIEIHEYMKHGEWRTSKAIASKLDKKLHSVRVVMLVIGKHWGYEVSKNTKKGYRRET